MTASRAVVSRLTLAHEQSWRGEMGWRVVAAAVSLLAASPALAQTPADGRETLPGTVVPGRHDPALRPDPAHMLFSAAVKVAVTTRAASADMVLNEQSLRFD